MLNDLPNIKVNRSVKLMGQPKIQSKKFELVSVDDLKPNPDNPIGRPKTQYLINEKQRKRNSKDKYGKR